MNGYQGERHTRTSQRGHTAAGVLAAAVIALQGSAAFAAAPCASAVAHVVSVQGIVEVRRFEERIWQLALLNSALCPGDSVRVRQHSRAALRLGNETLLRLDQKTALTLGAPEDGKTLLEMLSGALHALTRTPRPFGVRTPFLNAGIDGTEFAIGIDPDRTRLVVYEGRVSAGNEHGRITLGDHEAAVAARGEAPRPEGRIQPTDAVQWALHYPAILAGWKEGSPGEAPSAALGAAVAHQQAGQPSEALAAIADLSPDRYTADILAYRAGLLLSVGRADEADGDIARALALDPRHSGAHALRAMMRVVQNDKDGALALARQAVEYDPGSAAARLALSYAQQAHFKVEAALESVRQATMLDPANALAWARLAELHLATGYADRALAAAQRAAESNPRLAQTHTVLGFSHLARIDTDAARAAFATAIGLDSSDPMSRLGMGLAEIRDGRLEAGRIEMEIAASLDPANSLVRSYLGKAYFEERRYPLAATQFDLAKERDPRDPTPWLYDGIMQQTQNRPGEALGSLQQSIDLNDNRAVYRSKLLLDQDQAARGSSLARVYDNLGFERRAIMETARSLTLDPASHSAHRFLSDAYLGSPRHEIARVSELLQAQLLQPINVNPVQPQLALADLNIITGTAPAAAGFNEFAPLMERNRPQLVASGLFGGRGTRGAETVLSALYGRASASIGQFHYNTDGFRPNNDQKHNVYNAFLQFAVTPRFNVQAEVRTRKSEHGDLLLDFGRAPTLDRRDLSEDTARIGARYALSPHQDLLVSASYRNRRELQSFHTPAFIRGEAVHDSGYQAEAQYQLRQERFSAIAGGGAYRIDADRASETSFAPPPCPPELCPPIPPIRSDLPGFKRERSNGYVYTHLHLPRDFTPTLGLAYDWYAEAPDAMAPSEKRLSFGRLNPKVGLQWDASSRLRVRMAWFQTVKSALISQQTLEPTQVAGFNQMFDDVNGTRATRAGVGVDARIADTLYGGAEVSQRDLRVPVVKPVTQTLDYWQSQHEKLYRAYLYWLPHPNWALRGEYQFERFSRELLPSSATPQSGMPIRIETSQIPLDIRYYDPSGVFAQFKTTYVRQELERMSSLLYTGSSDFFMLDAVLGYRFPRRRGILSVEGRNLLDEAIVFRNMNFETSEPLYNQRYTPRRTFFVRLTLNF